MASLLPPPPPLSLWLAFGRVCTILWAGFFKMMEMKIYDGTEEKIVGVYVCVCVSVLIACTWVVVCTLPQSRYRG